MMKNGYERAKTEEKYYYVSDYADGVCSATEMHDGYSDFLYQNGNYYTDKKLAEDNARADRLMRQLRRFSAEYQLKPINWLDNEQVKFHISYNYKLGLCIDSNKTPQKSFGVIYFDSYETAKLAKEKFCKELIWYFTEYETTI
jgi:hypothetical protein